MWFMYCVRNVQPLVGKLYRNAINFLSDRERLQSGGSGAGSGENKGDGGDLFLYSPLKVVIFVAMMCGMLVLMYFFYSVLGEWEQQQYSSARVFEGVVLYHVCFFFFCFYLYSLCHHCHLLHGFCICVIQLFRCSAG